MITLHHLSSTGGTVITKLLSTSDDFFVLNEKHPARLWPIDQKNFAPNLVIEELVSRYGAEVARGVSAQDLARISAERFVRDLDVAEKIAAALGRKLLVRDWSHPDFLLANCSDKPQLIDTINSVEWLNIDHSFATIRNPVDAFISGVRSNFLTHISNDWETYCDRAIRFYNVYNDRGIPLLKYEQIVADPTAFLKQVSDMTGARFPEDYATRLDRFKFSGDSGRSSTEIKPREPRQEDVEKRESLMSQDCYKRAADLMGY